MRPPFDNYGLNNHAVRHTPWKKTLLSTAQGGQPLITLSLPSYHPDNNIQLIKHYEVPVI